MIIDHLIARSDADAKGISYLASTLHLIDEML